MTGLSAFTSTVFGKAVLEAGNCHWLTGCRPTAKQPRNWHAHAFVVIPAKAGIQAFQTFLDPSFTLRCGRDECSYPQRAYFRSVLRVIASAGSARAIARFASAI